VGGRRDERRRSQQRKPIVMTGSVIRMAPVIDANWVYVTDNSGW